MRKPLVREQHAPRGAADDEVDVHGHFEDEARIQEIDREGAILTAPDRGRGVEANRAVLVVRKAFASLAFGPRRQRVRLGRELGRARFEQRAIEGLRRPIRVLFLRPRGARRAHGEASTRRINGGATSLFLDRPTGQSGGECDSIKPMPRTTRHTIARPPIGIDACRMPGQPLDALEARLRRELTGEVLFDAWNRGRYSTDASIYQIEPLGVVVPRTADEAVCAAEAAVAPACLSCRAAPARRSAARPSVPHSSSTTAST